MVNDKGRDHSRSGGKRDREALHKRLTKKGWDLWDEPWLRKQLQPWLTVAMKLRFPSCVKTAAAGQSRNSSSRSQAFPLTGIFDFFHELISLVGVGQAFLRCTLPLECDHTKVVGNFRDFRQLKLRHFFQ
jgi:hypothetical protein